MKRFFHFRACESRKKVVGPFNNAAKILSNEKEINKMYINFDKKLSKTIKKLRKRIIDILEVDDVNFTMTTGENVCADTNSIELCFGSNIDDTYAALTFQDHFGRLEEVLENFMECKKTVWMNRGKIVKVVKRRGKNV